MHDQDNLPILIELIENNTYNDKIQLRDKIDDLNKNSISKLIRGDALLKLPKLKDASIDILITDPPYGIRKEGIKNSSDLNTFYSILPECHRVLKKDGFFITFFSTKLLPEIFKNNPFIYHWQFILNCPLSSVRSPIGFSKYMSCFIFKKEKSKIIKWNKDIFNDSPSKMVEPDEGFIDHLMVRHPYDHRYVLHRPSKYQPITSSLLFDMVFYLGDDSHFTFFKVNDV